MGERAVVLGGSMAGLLAARVLSDHFEQVTIVERDALSDGAEHRPGVPQGRHTHGMLACGARIIERLLPGITAELTPPEAQDDDALLHGRWFNNGVFAAQTESGLEGFGVTRPLLEAAVRRRVRALANVEVVDGHAARGLVASGARVAGVRIGPRRGGDETELAAAFVVDATGRASRAPEWLAALGYEPPEEDTVEVGIGYATRFYRRSPNDLGGDFIVNVAAVPPNRRMGIALAVEGDRWIVTLAGLLGDHPPLDDAGFLAFAAGLPTPVIHDLVARLEPLTDAVRTRFPAHRRVRYERLKRLPDRFVAVGDAVASFNPVYGQGMSVAAQEAVLLDRLLAAGVDGLPRRCYRAAARTIAVPWDIAVGNDLRFPEVQGPRGPRLRLVNRYVGRLQRVAAHDAAVARAFFEVGNLVAPPTSLLRPRIAARVLARPLRASKGVADATPFLGLAAE
jgi:2-polyprenyl-6-methoxyphenol hydroxylase-like FAD-dependent oxidoreductase